MLQSMGSQKVRHDLATEQHHLPIKTIQFRTSLVVQWLRLCAPNAGGLGSIPGQENRSHMLQLRPAAVKFKTKRKKSDGVSELLIPIL